jgi:hypothetical protein
MTMNTKTLVLRAFAIGAAVLGLAAPSGAGVLYTAPAESGLGAIPEHIWCSLLNTSSAPITVTMDGMNYKGDVVASQSQLAIDPGAAQMWWMGNGAIRCRFTFSTSTKRVVAGAFYTRLSDGKLVSYVPAQ